MPKAISLIRGRILWLTAIAVLGAAAALADTVAGAGGSPPMPPSQDRYVYQPNATATPRPDQYATLSHSPVPTTAPFPGQVSDMAPSVPMSKKSDIRIRYANGELKDVLMMPNQVATSTTALRKQLHLGHGDRIVFAVPPACTLTAMC